MADPTWFIDAARRAGTIGGAAGVPAAVIEDARGIEQDLQTALAEHKALVVELGKARAALAQAAQKTTQTNAGAEPQKALPPGVYVSAPAAAGLAFGALALGAIGGYATKAYMAKGQAKKLAETSDAAAAEVEDEGEEDDKRRIRR
jgi:hypothetical protein